MKIKRVCCKILNMVHVALHAFNIVKNVSSITYKGAGVWQK